MSIKISKKTLIPIIIACVVAVVTIFLIVYFTTSGNLFDTLHDIANDNYANISITINTQQDGFSLTSQFDVKNNGNTSIINYSVQNLAPINPDVGEQGNDTETSIGTVILVDGQVSSQTGDKVDVTFGDFTKLTLYFAKENFTNVKDEKGVFSAKVTAPQRFMDAPSLQCENMTVTFAYQTDSPYQIDISYLSQGGATVTITYTFS